MADVQDAVGNTCCRNADNIVRVVAAVVADDTFAVGGTDAALVVVAAAIDYVVVAVDNIAADNTAAADPVALQSLRRIAVRNCFQRCC